MLCPLGCSNPKATGQTLSQAALTAPVLAQKLDEVYQVMVVAKMLPDHRDKATRVLASLDAIAPMVKEQGDALTGDQFNWASFVVSAAITAAQVMGLWT